MPTIADYRVIEAGTKVFAVPIPNPWTGIEQEDYRFSATAVDAGSMSILFFRLHPTGETDSDCTVEIMLNNTNIFTRTLGPGVERSMHVAIPQGILAASDNQLYVTKVDGFVVLAVSEIIIFFQATI